jgi:hypothetical protein
LSTLPYPQTCYTTRGWLSNRSALFRGGGRGEAVTDEAVTVWDYTKKITLRGKSLRVIFVIGVSL